MSPDFDPIIQLEFMLANWYGDILAEDNDRTPAGVIVDYLFRTQRTLHDVFTMNALLYSNLFVKALGQQERKNLIQQVTTSLCELEFYASKQALTASSADGSRNELAIHILQYAASELLNDKSYCKNLVDEHKPFGYPLKDHTMIWHISDLHFGNLSPWDYSDLVGRFVGARQALDKPPDFIIVSGDLTSFCKKDEFKQAKDFFIQLSGNLWPNENNPGRILIVPGNHDICWKQNGKTDRGERFKELMESEDSSCWITPFSPDGKAYDSNATVKSISYPQYRNEIPPLVVVNCAEQGFDVALLVSTQYSGIADKELCGKIKELEKELKKKVNSKSPDETAISDSYGIEALKSKIIDAMRKDCGKLDARYLAEIGKLKSLFLGSHRRFVMTHHNYDVCGDAPCMAPEAETFRRYLNGNKVEFLFHGHVHESCGLIKTADTDRRISFCAAGALNDHRPSFNIYAFSKTHPCFHAHTWQLSLDGDFRKKDIREIEWIV